MSDFGEGLIFIGQLAQDWKKGDFSKSLLGCGSCGCLIALAVAGSLTVFAVVTYVLLK